LIDTGQWVGSLEVWYSTKWSAVCCLTTLPVTEISQHQYSCAAVGPWDRLFRTWTSSVAWRWILIEIWSESTSELFVRDKGV
jgi:hypothetical protein